MTEQFKDEEIKRKVEQALVDCIWVDASDLTVEAKYGHVYLRGEVVDREQKKAAEESTEKVPGVVDVINYITLKKDRGLIGDMPIKANML